MPDNKPISQLTTAEQTTSSDLFETSIPNGSLGYLSRKVSLDAIANFIAKALQYSDLQTEAKTLIDAINEAAQSGGGGASIEEMTQAEYNALTPEQKADGTLRAISDAKTSIGDIDDVNVSSPADGNVLAYDNTSSKWVNREIEAEDISYDNTSSGLNATDVNAAIDEINAKDASDIPYSAGVSVADKLDSLKIIKTGKANYTGLKGGGFADRVLVPVAFDSPMPNSAYVAFAMVNDAYNDFPFIRIYPFSKTATGFTAVCINQSGLQTAVSGSFDWVVIS